MRLDYALLTTLGLLTLGSANASQTPEFKYGRELYELCSPVLDQSSNSQLSLSLQTYKGMIFSWRKTFSQASEFMVLDPDVQERYRRCITLLQSNARKIPIYHMMHMKNENGVDQLGLSNIDPFILHFNNFLEKLKNLSSLTKGEEASIVSLRKQSTEIWKGSLSFTDWTPSNQVARFFQNIKQGEILKIIPFWTDALLGPLLGTVLAIHVGSITGSPGHLHTHMLRQVIRTIESEVWDMEKNAKFRERSLDGFWRNQLLPTLESIIQYARTGVIPHSLLSATSHASPKIRAFAHKALQTGLGARSGNAEASFQDFDKVIDTLSELSIRTSKAMKTFLRDVIDDAVIYKKPRYSYLAGVYNEETREHREALNRFLERSPEGGPSHPRRNSLQRDQQLEMKIDHITHPPHH